MNGLLNACLAGAAFSVISGTIAYGICRLFEARTRTSSTAAWQAARLVAILPVLLAPIIHFLPDLALPDFTLGGGGSDAGFDLQHTGGTARNATMLAPLGRGFAEAIRFDLIAMALYLAGLGVALAAAIARGRWMQAFMRETRLAAASERGVFDHLVQKLDVRPPEFRITPRSTSPFLTGWVPRIIAPETLFEDSNATRFALAHELTHLRRGDERDRLIGAALVSLFWFNLPLRWIEKGLSHAREIACDSESLKALGEADRKSYAAALINMMRSTAQPVSAFGANDRRHREMRIKAILNGDANAAPSKPLLAVILAAAFLPVACAQSAMTERSLANDAMFHPITEQVFALNDGAGTGDDAVFAWEVAEEDSGSAASVEIGEDGDVWVLRTIVDERGNSHVERTAIAHDGQSHDLALITEDGAVNWITSADELQVEGEDRRVYRVQAGSGTQGGHWVGATDADGSMELMRIEENGTEAPLGRWTVEEPAVVTAIEPVAPVAPVEPVAPRREKRLDPAVAQAPDLPRSIVRGRITSAYGARPAQPAGAAPFHGGTDIAAPTGTAIVAPGAGTVIHAAMGYQGSDRWGNTIEIDHGNGWSTVYAHLDAINVATGQTLSAGDQIGTVGTTGASTGPHVHVELHHAGERVDPADHMAGLD